MGGGGGGWPGVGEGEGEGVGMESACLDAFTNADRIRCDVSAVKCIHELMQCDASACQSLHICTP